MIFFEIHVIFATPTHTAMEAVLPLGVGAFKSTNSNAFVVFFDVVYIYTLL